MDSSLKLEKIVHSRRRNKNLLEFEMFKALLAAVAAAVAIARPIKESESFSAWKEEVSLFFFSVLSSRRQFQENVIKRDIYFSIKLSLLYIYLTL